MKRRQSTEASAKRSSKQRHGRRTYGRPRRVPWPLLIAVGIVAVLGFLIVRSLEIGAPGERIVASGVGQHVPESQPVTYNSIPPVGGPHWPVPAAWGNSTVPVPDERAVHNMEHGGVVVSYNAIPQDDLAKIQGPAPHIPTRPLRRGQAANSSLRPHFAGHIRAHRVGLEAGIQGI